MVWITCIWLVCDVVEGAGAAGRRGESVGVGFVWIYNISRWEVICTRCVCRFEMKRGRGGNEVCAV